MLAFEPLVMGGLEPMPLALAAEVAIAERVPPSTPAVASPAATTTLPAPAEEMLHGTGRLSLFSEPRAAAAFLDLDGIQGEATDQGHKDWVIIQSMSASIHRSIPSGAKDQQRTKGETSLGDIQIVRQLDKSSTKLMEACAAGKFFKEVEIEFCTVVKDKQEAYLKYKLYDVIVSSYSISGEASGNPLPSEQVSFSYSGVEWTYVPIAPKEGDNYVPIAPKEGDNKEAVAAKYNPAEGKSAAVDTEQPAVAEAVTAAPVVLPNLPDLPAPELSSVMLVLPSEPRAAAAFTNPSGIPGEATAPVYKDWVIIQKMSASIHRSIPSGAKDQQRTKGETTLGDVQIVRQLDRSSVKLMEACAAGTFFPEVEIHFCTVVKDRQEPYLKYKLYNVIITSYSTHGDASGNPLPSEQISLSYSKVDWTYVVVDPKTGDNKGSITTKYNPAEGKAATATEAAEPVVAPAVAPAPTVVPKLDDTPAPVLSSVRLNLFSEPRAAAAFTKLDGIQGEATDQGHKDWAIIQSMSASIHRSIPSGAKDQQRTKGETSLDDIKIVRQLDKSSVKIQEACASGKFFPTVEIEFCTAVKDQQVAYLKHKLYDVIVSRYSMHGDASGNPLPSEEIWLGYSKADWTYVVVNPETGEKKGEVAEKYDPAEGKAAAAATEQPAAAEAATAAPVALPNLPDLPAPELSSVMLVLPSEPRAAAAFTNPSGIPGEATYPVYKDWVIIQKMSASIHRSIPSGAKDQQRTKGETTLGNVQIVRQLDKSSVKLMEACTAGKFFKEVEIHFCTTVKDKQEPYLKYKLYDIIISSYSVHGDASGNPLPSEQISFGYSKVDWTYVVIDPKTGDAKGEVKGASYGDEKTGITPDYRTVEAGQTTVGSRPQFGDSPLVKQGDGTLVLAADSSATGRVTVTTGTLVVQSAKALGAGGLTVSAGEVRLETGYDTVPLTSLALTGGRLDLGSGRISVAAGGYDLASVRQWLLAGRNGGGWDGATGIVSRAAGRTAVREIGYTVTDGVLTIGWAAAGDANLDGLVNDADLDAVRGRGLYRAGGTSATWADGDFDYDGRVGVSDLVRVASTSLLNAPTYRTGAGTGPVTAVSSPPVAADASGLQPSAAGTAAPRPVVRTSTGSGVLVAVLDSGIDRTHPQLNDAIWSNLGEIGGDGIDNDANGFVDDVYGWNFISNSPDTLDRYGHGTHVAGIVAKALDGSGVTDVSSSIRIMPVSVLDDRGIGRYGSVASGIYYAVAQGAQIINHSVVGIGAEVFDALEFAREHGVLVVAASGNDAAARPDSPARYSAQLDNVISVGAVDAAGGFFQLTNRVGDSGAVQVDAVGQGVVSTIPGGGSGMMSGTSMAAGQVSGISAVIQATVPTLQAPDLRTALVSGAQRSNNGSDSRGTVDLAASLAAARSLAAAAGTSRASAAATAAAPQPAPAAAAAATDDALPANVPATAPAVQPAAQSSGQVGDAYVSFNRATGEIWVNPGHAVTGSPGISGYVVTMDPAIGLLSTNAVHYVFPTGDYTAFAPQTGADAGNAFGAAFFTLTVPGGGTGSATFSQTTLAAGGPRVRDAAIPGYEGTREFSFGAIGPIGLSESRALAAFGASRQGGFATGSGGYSLQDVVGLQAFRVFVDPNRGPTDIVLTASAITENLPAGTVVGSLGTTDSDANEVFAYAIVPDRKLDGTTMFEIVGNQLRTKAPLDFEAKATYSIRIRSTDSGGLYTGKVFTVTVNDVNEAPSSLTLSSSVVAENQPAGTVVGSLVTTDSDVGETFTYAIVPDRTLDGTALFEIVGNQLRTKGPLDFEAKATSVLRIRSTDRGGLFVGRVITVTVGNVNETPTAVSLSATSVAENRPAATVVGTFTTTDPDAGDAFRYTIVPDATLDGMGRFTIVGNELRTTGPFDFEAKSSYRIRVRSLDKGGLFVGRVITITVTNVNEAPLAIAVSSLTVADNLPAGTTVGVFSTSDPDADGTFRYIIVPASNLDGTGHFEIVGNQLRTKASFKASVKSSYAVRVRSTDQGGLSTSRVITINVTA